MRRHPERKKKKARDRSTLFLPRPCPCPRIVLGWEDRRARESLHPQLFSSHCILPQAIKMEAKSVQTFLSLKATHLDPHADLEGSLDGGQKG